MIAFRSKLKSAKTPSAIRAELKKNIQGIRIFGQAMYEVSINEKEAKDASRSAWDQCMEEARVHLTLRHAPRCSNSQ